MNLISNKVWAALAVASLAATATQAASITGSLWVNQVSASQSATIKNIPTTTPDVTFSVNSPLNFNSYVGGYTVGGFLQSGGATILTGSDLSGHSLDNTFIAFMGQVTVANGETFTVTHDDGLQLKIGESLLINEPGPFAPTTDTWTYTGNPGTYPFVLTYGESWGAPAVLQISLPLENVPDGGATIALLGGAITTLGMMYRRVRK